METTDRQNRHRRPARLLRFGLRFMFVLMTAIGVWFAVVSNNAKSQRRAVQRLGQLGGRVGFDYQFDENGSWRKDPQLPAPVWLVDLIGEDYARSVVIVNFDEGSDPTNDGLAVVADLSSLEQLTLMRRTQISDDGLRHLSQLTNLEVLALNGTNVQGEGLRHIRGLRSLKGLTLDNTPVTDEALKHIAQLSQLEWLHLNNTQITDDGLREMASLPRLEDLQLRGTSISDEDIMHLSDMTSLKRVLLGDNVSKERRSWLQAELPNCEVN